MSILEEIRKEMLHSIPGEHLCELPEWSEDIARDLAREEGIELIPEHWEVIHCLRELYDREGNVCSGTAILRMLDDRFDREGGGKYLYRLFPKGPVHQGMRIAGLPAPQFSVDRSFGSVT
jgi:tRNA 2-thiouridine synthesizing protein E